MVCSTGHCIDAISVEVGYGDESTKLLRVAVSDFWRKREPLADTFRLAGYWELSGAIWDNAEESTADIGVTPVFRFELNRFYLEAAIGVHLVQTHISAHRTFSTAFQFGDHIGAGVHFKSYDVCVRLQHLSNGSIRDPNPGINFVLVRLQYALE
jgi:hypothetical protein